jgi:large subunit ribosomal protein L9
VKVKVLLKDDIAGLGQIGEIVEVAAGYARNRLFPMGLAMKASAGTQSTLASLQKKRDERETQRKKTLEEVAASLRGTGVAIHERVGETGTLYGAVSEEDIAKALLEQRQIEIEPQMVRLEKHLKTLGPHEVTLRLHPDIEEVVLTIEVLEAEESAVEGDEDDDDDGRDADHLYGAGLIDDDEDDRRDRRDRY